MNEIKVAELFYSIQGEGKFQGVPSVFLRTFGCNFRCKGFGMPLGEETQEITPIIDTLDNYKSYNELPLVSTGCDTYAAIYPEFKKFSSFISVDEISKNIINLLPYKKWQGEHLVITGGEPLLGWQKAFPNLLEQPEMDDLQDITFETNGTQSLRKEFKEYLLHWTKNPPKNREITFSVSAKLSCSGETREKAIQPNIVCEYEEYGYTYLKLVVSTNEDAEEALETIDIYRAAGFTGPVYLMPVGGVESVYHLNNRRVAELALKYGLRYSDRLQVPLFKNQWNT